MVILSIAAKLIKPLRCDISRRLFSLAPNSARCLTPSSSRCLTPSSSRCLAPYSFHCLTSHSCRGWSPSPWRHITIGRDHTRWWNGHQHEPEDGLYDPELCNIYEGIWIEDPDLREGFDEYYDAIGVAQEDRPDPEMMQAQIIFVRNGRRWTMQMGQIGSDATTNMDFIINRYCIHTLPDGMIIKTRVMQMPPNRIGMVNQFVDMPHIIYYTTSYIIDDQLTWINIVEDGSMTRVFDRLPDVFVSEE